MASSLTLVVLLVAIFAVAAFAAESITPQGSYLAQMREDDPMGQNYCICTGAPGSSFEKCDAWEACLSCATGQIALNNSPAGGKCLSFGFVGGVASTWVDITAAINLGISNEFNSLHFENNEFVFQKVEDVNGTKTKKWVPLPSAMTGVLNKTLESGPCAPETPGSILLVRVTTGAQDTLDAGNLVFFKAIVMSDRKIRWNVFYGDATCAKSVATILAFDDEKAPLVPKEISSNDNLFIGTIIAVSGLLILIIILFVCLFKRTGKGSDYNEL